MRKPALALIAAAACWGAGNVASKYALGGIDAMTVLVIELLAATVVLWTFVLLRGHKRPANIDALALLGLLEPGLTYAALDFGLARTSAANASLLSGTESVFVVILAAVFLGQRFSANAVLAVAVASIGIAALGGSAPSANAGWGDLLIIGGTVCAAIYVTLASRIAPDVDALTMTAYQFLFGTIAAVGFAIVNGAGAAPTATVGNWAVAVAAGIVSLGLSSLLYNYAIASVSVSTAGMVLNLIPIFGLAGAVLVLGETVTAWQYLGGRSSWLGWCSSRVPIAGLRNPSGSATMPPLGTLSTRLKSRAGSKLPQWPPHDTARHRVPGLHAASG